MNSYVDHLEAAIDGTRLEAHVLQTMHKELEGKQYVEQYIQSLTHEIKSPVSAIHGAAELINEEMTHEQQSVVCSDAGLQQCQPSAGKRQSRGCPLEASAETISCRVVSNEAGLNASLIHCLKRAGGS